MIRADNVALEVSSRVIAQNFSARDSSSQVTTLARGKSCQVRGASALAVRRSVDCRPGDWSRLAHLPPGPAAGQDRLMDLCFHDPGQVAHMPKGRLEFVAVTG